MKAPDKIFLYRGHPEPYWFKDKQIDSDIEYIRKDALMEWIQEVRAIPHENGIARDLAFQEVVNKLNSM